MLACSECECELFDSSSRESGESFDDFIIRRIEKWNTRPEPGRGQTRAGKKSGREKGDVWNLKVFVEDGRELTRARDKFQAVIHILRDRPFSVADSNLIMFMRMVRDSVRIAPPP
jgi:hypothetical protein